MPKTRIEQAVKYLKEKIKTPELLIILGSGLGDYADTFSHATMIPYSDIPGSRNPLSPDMRGNWWWERNTAKRWR